MLPNPGRPIPPSKPELYTIDVDPTHDSSGIMGTWRDGD